MSQALRSVPGGDLIDVGCGPGMMVRELLDSRPGDFRISAIDRSPAMVTSCRKRAGKGNVRALVGRIEAMPFPDASFDVTLAMGVLEYADAETALAEMVRVTRPNGLLLVTMLNPISPYRLIEWHVYWPLLRVLRGFETIFRVPAEKRHGPIASGIRAFPAYRLRRMMVAAGLRPVDSAYFDVTFMAPPFDRVGRRFVRGWQNRPEGTVSRRGLRRFFGTAYLVVARRV